MPNDKMMTLGVTILVVFGLGILFLSEAQFQSSMKDLYTSCKNSGEPEYTCQTLVATKQTKRSADQAIAITTGVLIGTLGANK